MNQTGRVQGTSRQAEEAFLEQTLSVIRNNLENYGEQVRNMRSDIDEMLDHFHDDNPELINLLENSITLHDHMKRALERNEKARDKPYFGRIDFYDETLEKEESLYIGKGGISIDATHQAVVDWRAPVASAYYENGLGKCSYTAPGGRQMNIDLKLKRTYEIEKGKLLDYFDSEVVANDELLTKYLAKNKQAVLNEIVATIQKEQNEIIRKSPYHNIIVQGVAGSGKTTVAMHRISFILYNYEERFKPDDFYIVGSNRILLNYITGVLPDLDVYGVRQMTMEQLFVRLLYEDWDERKFCIKKSSQKCSQDSIRGTSGWFGDLKKYCDALEWQSIQRESVYLNPRQFVEGLRDGKAGVYDETDGKETDPRNLVLLVDGEAVERYIQQNPKISMQNKINMLNERLMNKIKEEFLGKGVKYTEAERKAILKAYRGRYGSREWKGSIYALYRDFLKRQIARGKDVEIPEHAFDVYDLAALAYLYKRIKETEVISEAHHIVIDEAQDFGMMAYLVLHFCIEACTYTVMGDVSQNIHFGLGLNDWEELRKLLLSDPMDSFGILKKSYRNTVEISGFATHILHHGRFSSYPIEPIIRHGEPVRTLQCEESNLGRKAADICRKWMEKGFDTIAVVCRSQPAADRAAEELGQYIQIMENDLETAQFGKGIMVLPVEYTKGLEFDAVLILNPTREDYPVDDGHAKLLYVAATRALHELCVLHTESITGLIVDPIPEDRENCHTESESDAPKGPDKLSAAKLPPAQEGSKSRLATSQSQVAERIPANVRRPRAVIMADNTKKPGGSSLTAVYTARPAAPAMRSKEQPPARQPEKPAHSKASRPAFGDIPPTEKLRPAGHSKIDLAIRWITKQSDGLYLQSRYGTLRLSPIGSAIIRVTFVGNTQPDKTVHPGIAIDRTEKFWMYKDAGAMVELTTDELALQIDKATGAIRYMTRDRKLLLAERGKECRQLERLSTGGMKIWNFLKLSKEEHLYGFGPKEQAGIGLKGTARYLSYEKGLPFLLSDNGYGILIAADSPVFFCDIPAYGSYLHIENAGQLDFYFIAGKKQDTLLKARAYLTGDQ